MNQAISISSKARALAAAKAAYMRLSQAVTELAIELPSERTAAIIEQLTVIRRAIDRIQAEVDDGVAVDDLPIKPAC